MQHLMDTVASKPYSNLIEGLAVAYNGRKMDLSTSTNAKMIGTASL